MKSPFNIRIAAILFIVTLSSCGSGEKKSESASGNAGSEAAGSITIDGSSTVYPITEAIAEEYRADHGDVRVTVCVSGTGGVFKKFGRGEIDINDASRPIKEQESATCKENNIEYVEITVAFDGLYTRK